MSFSLFQANLPFRTVIKYLRYFPCDGSIAADEWSNKEAELLTVGDILFFLDVTRSQFGSDPSQGIGVSEGDSFRASSLINVFRLDGDWPMGFVMAGDNFDWGFVGELLTAKAEAALENKTGLYYLLARLNEPLKPGQHLTDLGEMHKWGNNGSRSNAPKGLADPLHIFLLHLGIAVDPSGEKQPVELDSLAYYLFNDEDTEPSSNRVPNLRSKMSGVRKEAGASDTVASAPEQGGAALSLSALFDDVPKAPGSPGGPPATTPKPGGLGISSLFTDWTEPAATPAAEPAAASKPAIKTGEAAKPNLADLFAEPADSPPAVEPAAPEGNKTGKDDAKSTKKPAEKTAEKPEEKPAEKPAPTGLAALFPDWEDSTAAPPPAAVAKPTVGGLGALFTDWEDPKPEPKPAAEQPAPAAETDVTATEPAAGSQSVQPESEPAKAASHGGLSSLFSDWEEPAPAVPAAKPADTLPTSAASDALNDMFPDGATTPTVANSEPESIGIVGEWQEPPLTEPVHEAAAPEQAPASEPPTEFIPAEEPEATVGEEDFGQMAAALEEVAAGLDTTPEVFAPTATVAEAPATDRSTAITQTLEAAAEGPATEVVEGATAEVPPEATPIEVSPPETPVEPNDAIVEARATSTEATTSTLSSLFSDMTEPAPESQQPTASTSAPSLSSLFSDMLPDAFPEQEPQLSSVLSDLAAATDTGSQATVPAAPSSDAENTQSLSALFSDFQSDDSLSNEQADPEVTAESQEGSQGQAAPAPVEQAIPQETEVLQPDPTPVVSTAATSAATALPPLLELPPIPVRSPAQPVPSPSVPGSLTAALLDLKLGSGLMPGGSSGLIAKLEQQAQRAGVRLEEKLIEIQERLIKDRIFNLRKVQIKEEASDRNITNLKSVLFRKVTAAGDEVKNELRNSAEEARTLLAGFAETASHGILQERETLLTELAASPEEITPLSIQGESLLVHLERARERGLETLNTELKVHTDKLDLVEAEIMDELQARLTKLRARVAVTESAVLAEERAEIDRCAKELQEVRTFVTTRLSALIEQLCASLSRSAHLAGLNLSMEADRLCREVLLERIASAKQSLPGLTLTLREQVRLELDSDAEVRLAEIAPLLNTSKDTIDAMAKEAVEITVFTGDKEKTDLEQALAALSNFFEEKTEEIKALSELTSEELTTIENEIASLSNTSSIESEPEIAEARVAVLQRLQKIGNDLNDHVNDSLRGQIANMEDKARVLQEDLISSMEADAYSVRKTADSSIQKLRDTAEAIRARIKSTQDQYIS